MLNNYSINDCLGNINWQVSPTNSLYVGLQLYREGKNKNTLIAKQLGTLHSYICIVAFYLGMIDEPREGCDVGAEPEDGGHN